MENNYTAADFVILYEEAPNTIFYNSLKTHFLGPYIFLNDCSKEIESKIYHHVKKYNSMVPEYRVFLYNFYSITFKTNYEYLPLHINDGDEMLYTIKWRLKIGK